MAGDPFRSAERLLRSEELTSATFDAPFVRRVDPPRHDPTSSSDSASSAAARRSGSYRTRPPSLLSVRYDVSPEGAGDSSTTVAVADELTDVHAGDKRERSPEVAVGDGSAATASGDRHLADDPHEGAVPPLQPCRALTASSYLHSQPVIC